MVVNLKEMQKLVQTVQLWEIDYIGALALQCFYFEV